MSKSRNTQSENWRQEPTNTSSEYRVELIKDVGDLLVVNAARASFATVKKKLDTNDEKLINFLCREKHINPFYHWRIAVKWDHITNPYFIDRHDAAGYDYDSDAKVMTLNVFNDPSTFVRIFGADNCISGQKLLEYGHTGKQWENLELTEIDPDSDASWRTLRITCDIPTARQWFKSKIGADESEESRRYMKVDPTLYIPPVFRQSSVDIKQGSSTVPFPSETADRIREVYVDSIQRSRYAYNELLELGLCAEQARFVLPQAMMTTFVDTISVRTLKRIHRLRSASDAQKEINSLINEVIRVGSVKI